MLVLEIEIDFNLVTSLRATMISMRRNEEQKKKKEEKNERLILQLRMLIKRCAHLEPQSTGALSQYYYIFIIPPRKKNPPSNSQIPTNSIIPTVCLLEHRVSATRVCACDLTASVIPVTVFAVAPLINPYKYYYNVYLVCAVCHHVSK